MTGSTTPTTPTLSFEQADAVGRAIVPTADVIPEMMAGLKAAGFEAWVPYHEFVLSFAESEEERDNRMRYIAEWAKQLLGKPNPFRFTKEQFARIYISSYIQKLRQERDAANGVPTDELSRRYPGEFWRHALEACERRKQQFESRNREAYGNRWEAMLEEGRRRLEDEVIRHATDLHRGYVFDRKGRYGLFTAAMARDAAPLGFSHDKARSRASYPVFSKPLGPRWDLCWTLETGEDFHLSPLEGRFTPCLAIRSRDAQGRPTKLQLGEFLEIRYPHLIPGFCTAYWKFFGLDELETMIKAHLCLYSLMAPILEPGLQGVLGGT